MSGSGNCTNEERGIDLRPVSFPTFPPFIRRIFPRAHELVEGTILLRVFRAISDHPYSSSASAATFRRSPPVQAPPCTTGPFIITHCARHATFTRQLQADDDAACVHRH